ncbi:MAG: hypothetical protein LBO04_02920 [Spirochaetaceae bacterium]|jgi:hypothetical protein|nr:hypothetical protein [Spirochaetaceae bacterium]
MLKQFNREIEIGSPAFICTVYPIAALLVILVFRLIFPDMKLAGSAFDSETRLLDVFRIGNSLTRGLLDFTMFFPAIFMSAQLLPFRRVPPQKNVRYQHFSPEFFKLLRPQLIAAVLASIVYSLLFLIVRPLCSDYQVDIRTKSILFNEAKVKAILFSNRQEWTEASRFLLVCDKMWPGNAEIERLREIIGTGLARIQYSRPPIPEKPAGSGLDGIPEQSAPLNALSALNFAEKAFSEERYYDAHRLAVLAERLSVPGSGEAAQAMRLSGTVWNMIESQEPDAAELERRAIYRRKRDGYEAMNSGDWIKAYYTFSGLLTETPDDPDIQKFLDLSEEGLAQTAFFINEMDRRPGAELSRPVFSLPLFGTEGRAVMRLASLSSSSDYSYGKNLELAAFDSEQNPLYSVKAPYVKFLPLYIGDRQLTVVYLQAWNRDYEQMHWGPEWYGAPPENEPKNQLVLAINYEDFLLASIGREKLDGLFLGDIWSLAGRLAPYGYVPEVYQAEIVNSIVTPMLFLPLVVFILAIGWKLRGRKHRSLAIYPMFLALPIILAGLTFVIHSLVNTSAIFLVLSFGFTAALVICFFAAFILFVLGIIFLASPRSCPPPPPLSAM